MNKKVVWEEVKNVKNVQRRQMCISSDKIFKLFYIYKVFPNKNIKVCLNRWIFPNNLKSVRIWRLSAI